MSTPISTIPESNPSNTPSPSHATPFTHGTDATPGHVRRRNGHVARLPKMAHDLVNNMLEDGASYPKISEALDALGHKVSARNISNWFAGGHQDWLKEQEAIRR